MLGIAIYLVWMACYHLAHTFLVRGHGLISGELLMMGKEIIWFTLVGVLLSRKRRVLWGLRNKLSPLIIVLLSLCIRAGAISWRHGIPWRQQIIGFKYDILPLIILMSAIMVGCVISVQEYRTRYTRLLLLIGILLIGGLLWQGGKIFFHDFYTRRGYGSVGDFVQGTAPPIYYRTGHGGSMRLQGLFAGPNNYGFWLVSIASFWLVMIGLFKNKKLLIGGGGIFFFSLLLTLSRGAWIGVCLQILFLLYMRGSYRVRRILYLTTGICIVGLVGVSILKQASTQAHMQALLGAVSASIQQPLGYGLGMSGPAVHFGGNYLPENHYFQLLLDIGFPGLLLWCLSLYILIRPGIKSINKTYTQHSEMSAPVALLTLGICGLLIEGMFLHVFEDSMVTYLFLVPLGIALGGEIRLKK